MRNIFGVVLVLLVLCAVAAGDERMALRRDAVVTAVEKSSSAVVNISTEKIVQRGFFFHENSPFSDPLLDQFMKQFSRPEIANSLGSGGMFTPDGFIFTNAHVVNRASKIMVTLSDGSQYPAELVNVDVANDLAVIKIQADRPLSALVLGRSDDLMVGEKAIAVGNPFGLSNTVTQGVISALHRDVVVQGRVMFRDILQTDALINPGNSGGPLLNLFGEVIAVTTAMRADAAGIGFAIPVDRAKRSLAALLDYKKLKRLQLGLRLEEKYTGQGADAMLTIANAEKDGPAAKAGLETGDVIVELGGRRIKTLVDFMAAVLVTEGKPMTVRAERGDRMIEGVIEPTVIPRPDGLKLAREMLGLSIQQMNRGLARDVGINIDKGILIADVASGSTGEAGELARGDIILQVNDTLAADMDAFATALEAAADSDKLYLVILRRQGMAVAQYAAEVEVRH